MSDDEDRKRWLAARKEIVGASEVAAVMGAHPYDSAFAVWARKCDLAPEEEDNEAMELGRELEPVVARIYERRTGRTVIDYGRTMQRHHPRGLPIAATEDREIDVSETAPLEIKTTGQWLAKDWNEEPPIAAQLQLQTQMACRGPTCGWGSIAVLIAGRTFRYADIERRDDVIEIIEARCIQFMEYVRKREPPPIDASVATLETLRRMYPVDNGATVLLPAEAGDWARELDMAKKQIKEWESRQYEAANKLRAAIGPATTGILVGGGSYSLRTVSRKEYTVKATSYRVLRKGNDDEQ